ncbi:hypothetical protein YC2023_051145 [Brassica napus]
MRYDTEASKLVSLQSSLRLIVRCIKALMISLVYITSSQPELCTDLCVCEEGEFVSLSTYLHVVKRVIEYIRKELVCNFYELTDKNTCYGVLRDGCWSKVHELYIGDSQDAYLDTLQEYFTLGKHCVQILWMRHLINGYGNIPNYIKFITDTEVDQFTLKRKAYVRARHINVQHHFVFNMLEEKLAILKHKTSVNQFLDVYRKPLDLSSLLHVREALGIKSL